ncbi:type III secretion system cytoplasmic ring protein SctQ [Burkholderia ubonensis]|uniref:type III secretion system cytoplasmic ring protein SctQ n=1 Tax=Burkholderia ubonensis TaxID=101571 RepID=UPI0009B4A17A|nr:type III secretion system cytoplasmic ring protein SctQ [Burkholderia ubonensis]
MRRLLARGRECAIRGDPLWIAIRVAEWRKPIPNDTELRFTTPIGEIRLATPHWLSTVSGIHFQSGDNAPHSVLLELAAAGLPPDLTSLWGGAWLRSQTHEEPIEPLVPLLLEAVDAHSTHHAALIRMRAGDIVSLLADSRWRHSAITASQPPQLDALPVLVAVAAGTTQLHMHTLAGLRVGDAVIVESPSFDVHGEGTLALGAVAMCVQRLDEASCHLEFLEWDATRFTHASSGSLSFSHAASANSTMENASDLSRPSAHESDTAPFEDIPVTLTFVVGKLQSTIGELRAMAPGQVLEWQANTQGKVAIEANGALIGYGELVEVDGKLSVELTHWSVES